MRWYPSPRRPVTRRETVSFAGARSRVRRSVVLLLAQPHRHGQQHARVEHAGAEAREPAEELVGDVGAGGVLGEPVQERQRVQPDHDVRGDLHDLGQVEGLAGGRLGVAARVLLLVTLLAVLVPLLRVLLLVALLALTVRVVLAVGVLRITHTVHLSTSRAANRDQAPRSNSSARASGRTPARVKASASTRPASERRSILRRWPNPASTTPNSRSRSTAAASGGGGRRRILTRTDSTRGSGTKTVGGTRPTTSASAQ